MRSWHLGVAGATATLLLAACSTSGAGASNESGPGYRFSMVTHGDNGTFWSVVRKGENQAASDLGVTVNYQGSNNDDAQECQFVNAAMATRPGGLVVSPHSQTLLDCAKRVVREEMRKLGIEVRDPEQTVGTLSGGERQALAIARAVYFRARVLILDEPTSALGVRQSGIVLRYIVQARERGLGVIFITHNPHHAFPVGNRFVLLDRGRLAGTYARGETSLAS
jgi:ABC-type sugar transport system ATPase subunit